MPPGPDDLTATAASPGSQFGPYRIEGLLGAGGMGQVYRAADTRLGRQVALKLCADRFTDRFQREARAIAALNHPHICTLYDVGPNYLVMELVEGETLAARIQKGKLSIEDTVRYGAQIAAALAEAHAKGIIHRDLKPGNVMVAKTGVKVLDFGLAKSAGDETVTAAQAVLGTLAYMAPEQRAGKECDARTDIYALGRVLREMATGSREATTADLPPHLAHVVDQCLANDPDDRWQAASDVRKELEWAAKAQPLPVAHEPRAGRRRWAVAPALACVLAAAAAGLAVWFFKPASPKLVTRLTILLPPGQRLSGDRPELAISPDGTRLVYETEQGTTSQLYLREMNAAEARAIPGTSGARAPFFSPDSQWIGFSRGGKLEKLFLNGGPAVSLADVYAGGTVGASWSSQGIIAFSEPLSPVRQISDAGGAVHPITRLERGEFPEFLPGGKDLLFGIPSNNSSPDKVAVQTLGADDHRELLPAGVLPRYAPSGHLVYLLGANLMAVPFDLRRLATSGSPVPVIEDVLSLQYSFSATGSLVYAPASIKAARLRLVWVDRHGAERQLPAPARNYVMPRISPDWQRVAVGIEEADNQVWIYDLGRDTLTRLTFEGATNGVPVWTPDNRRIVFKGSQNRLFWQPADGSDRAEPLTNEPLAPNNFPGSWSPDGQALVFTEDAVNRSLWILPLKDRKPQPLGHSPWRETAPRFSPDGRWIAYASNESGRFEIYVRPYPGPGGKWQISTDGGTEVVWNPKGRELFYRNGEKMMVVDVTTEPVFSAGKARVLFEGAFVLSPRSQANYDVSSDGQRFLMLEATEEGQSPEQINVVLNWFDELKRRVPSGTK